MFEIQNARVRAVAAIRERMRQVSIDVTWPQDVQDAMVAAWRRDYDLCVQLVCCRTLLADEWFDPTPMFALAHAANAARFDINCEGQAAVDLEAGAFAAHDGTDAFEAEYQRIVRTCEIAEAKSTRAFNAVGWFSGE